MPGTYTKLLYHVVFSTKYREPRITDNLGGNLYPYIGGIIRGERGSLIEIGGMPDHLHLLARFRADIAPAKMVQFIKGNSSHWINEQSAGFQRFAWQVGYGAFTVSERDVREVRRYIQQQKQHHEKTSFKEEFVRLLNEHEIEYEERYLWD